MRTLTAITAGYSRFHDDASPPPVENPTLDREFLSGRHGSPESHPEFRRQGRHPKRANRLGHSLIQERRNNPSVDNPREAFQGFSRFPASFRQSAAGYLKPDAQAAGIRLSADEACRLRFRPLQQGTITYGRERQHSTSTSPFVFCLRAIPPPAVCASRTKRFMDLVMCCTPLFQMLRPARGDNLRPPGRRVACQFPLGIHMAAFLHLAGSPVKSGFPSRWCTAVLRRGASGCAEALEILPLATA